jgi:tripartite-type tricarboxylate transporter receptor subunit TctC
MQEEGFDGFEATTWYGLAGPGKLSAGITNKINRDVNTILAMPDGQEKLDTYGAEDGGGTPEKFAQFIRSEQEKWARVVKDANVKIEA